MHRLLTVMLQVDEIPHPTIYDTVLFKLPKWAYNRTIGKALNKQTMDAQMEELVDEPGYDQEESAAAALKSAAQPNMNAESRKRRAKRDQ